MTQTHGKEIKEPTCLFVNTTPDAVCELFETHLPERLDTRTAGMPPVTARFLMKNNTYVSFVFDAVGKDTSVTLADYNSGSLTGMVDALKALFDEAFENKAAKEKSDLQKRKENEKRAKEVMERVKKERAAKNV